MIDLLFSIVVGLRLIIYLIGQPYYYYGVCPWGTVLRLGADALNVSCMALNVSCMTHGQG